MAKSVRKRAPQRQNALTLLRSDHEEVSDMVARYEKGKKRLDARQKETLATEICQALTVHAQIEEEVFYPACREHVERAEDLLAEAKVEHQVVKDLIAKIEAESPGSEEYDAQVKVLGEYVKHHVKEEQNGLFPKIRKSDLDLKSVGEQLAARKAELQQNATARAA
jgi:hemerythrin-like domain-containing protein